MRFKELVHVKLNLEIRTDVFPQMNQAGRSLIEAKDAISCRAWERMFQDLQFDQEERQLL